MWYLLPTLGPQISILSMCSLKAVALRLFETIPKVLFAWNFLHVNGGQCHT